MTTAPNLDTQSTQSGFRAAPFQERFIEAGGVRLHYLDYGAVGRTPMLYLHGGAVNAHWFDFVAAGFTADYHVRALDQRGHGDSAWADPPDYSYERYAADVAEVVAKLDLRDFVMVGHSMGGLVSLVYAATYPGRVKKIVIVDSTLIATPDRVAVLHEVGAREGRSHATHREFVENFRVRPAGTTAAPEILRYLAERSGRQGPDGRWRHKFDRNVYSKRVFLDIPPYWNRIGIPALLVKGGRSERITPQIVADAKSRCARVELAEVPGADHHVTLDNPDGFVAAVSAWLGMPRRAAAARRPSETASASDGAHLMTSAMSSEPLPRATPASLGLRPDRLQVIRSTLEAEIAANKLPGAVLAIARRGRLGFFEAFGFLDKEGGLPMRTDAVFSIASMTKPLATVAALILAEEGRVLVNEPVVKYLPQFANLSVASPRALTDAAHVNESVPVQRQMTVRDLMRHTAGISYGNRGSSAFHKNYLTSSTEVAEQMSGAEFLERLARLPLHFQPGAAWDYSFGLDVLGLVVEAVSGQSLGAFLDQRVFKPLGMSDTGFIVPAESVPRFAKGLPCDPLTGKPQRFRDSTRPHKFECGGGCGVSTAGDYLRFAQMLLNGGTLDDVRILGRKTVEYMTADHLGSDIDAAKLNAWPNLDGYGFGLGVAVRRRSGGGGMPSSAGEFHWSGATGTYFWCDPAEELTAVFMAHAPGAIRFYYRQLLHTLVLQALA